MSSNNAYGLVNVTIDGQTYNADTEYTAQQVAAAYQAALQTFVDVYNTPASSATTSITQTTADQMSAAIQQLLELAQNGMTVSVDPSIAPQQYYLTSAMGSDLDLLIQSLKASGVTNPSASITAAQAQMWYNLSTQSPVIAGILNSAINDSGDANRSLQALVEVVYVKTGNEVISDSLASLENALQSTQDSLNILQDLQTLHNEVQPGQKAPFSTFFNVNRPGTNSDPSAFAREYPAAASAYFGQTVNPILASNLGSTNAAGSAVIGPGFEAALQQLISLRTRIANEITVLTPITNSTSAALADTLLGRMQSVLADLNKYFAVSGVPVTLNTPEAQAFTAFKSWMLDNNTSSTGATGANAGLIQQNITFAITAAESTNDSQKSAVRNYLFIFEEYYKSASQMLQNINDMITKMAQNISK